ncbi:MAG TPA: hypothetical protein VJN18_00150 [Polyangiaceae bacterium]|nr:hypothetical protein [Polyangiaceae bacterium]
MNLRLALPAGLLGLLAAASAQAEAPQWVGSAPTADFATGATRRSDFTLGASGSFAFGRAQGYPNEIDKINQRAYASNTKLGLGTSLAVWVGVAFNDYLTFGLGAGGLGLTGNDREANGGAFLFHIDAYPLFDVDKSLRDLALFGHFGTGPLEISGGDEAADGGLMAYVEGGMAYEGLRLWRFGIGPSVSVLHMWSESASVTAATVGGRLAFYSGP